MANWYLFNLELKLITEQRLNSHIVKLALENRLEIREQDIQTELNKINLRRQQSEGLPQIDLNAYYEKAGYYGQDLGPEFSTSLNGAMKDYLNRPQNYGVGMSVSIPCFGKKSSQ